MLIWIVLALVWVFILHESAERMKDHEKLKKRIKALEQHVDVLLRRSV